MKLDRKLFLKGAKIAIVVGVVLGLLWAAQIVFAYYELSGNVKRYDDLLGKATTNCIEEGKIK